MDICGCHLPIIGSLLITSCQHGHIKIIKNTELQWHISQQHLRWLSSRTEKIITKCERTVKQTRGKPLASGIHRQAPNNVCMTSIHLQHTQLMNAKSKQFLQLISLYLHKVYYISTYFLPLGVMNSTQPVKSHSKIPQVSLKTFCDLH